MPGPDACARVIAGTANPQDYRDCQTWRMWMEIIRISYLIKFIPPTFPPPIGPDPGPLGRFIGDPNPQPNFPALNFYNNSVHAQLFGGLILDTLRRDSVPGPSIFNEIRESGVQLQVVQELLPQFEKASKFLKEELGRLEKEGKALNKVRK